MNAAIPENWARAAWEVFRDHLDGIRVSTGEELLRYPQPATECDLHYRDLLERRRWVNEELSVLKAREPGAQLNPDSPDWPDWRAWFEKQVSASAFADDAVRQEIVRLLGAEKAL
jgi:hypothetical protein